MLMLDRSAIIAGLVNCLFPLSDLLPSSGVWCKSDILFHSAQRCTREQQHRASADRDKIVKVRDAGTARAWSLPKVRDSF